MKKHIRKVAVIGSGIMGSGIACHFANIGVEVMLFDIAPDSLLEHEEKSGLDLSAESVRNRIVDSNLKSCLKSKPSPIYHKDFAKRITTGTIDHDLKRIEQADWIIEVVVERLDIKREVFDKIEKFRKPGTLVTTNTSGIPIRFMNEGRSQDFKNHFAVTHFFNPPRYLKLFEVIPGPDCHAEVVDFLMEFGEKFLGKKSVLAKDTPAFIGNRIGIFGIMSLLHQVVELDLTIEEIDKLTGPVIGRPKSATFRTVDVVGLDTLVHVAKGLYENCKEDEAHDLFKLPAFIETMMKNNWLGSKSGQGFYKKSMIDGRREILSLDLNTLEYRKKKKASFKTLELTKNVDRVKDRFKILIGGKDKAAQFYRKNFAAMFAYVQNRIPEISDDLYRIDDAMKAGFGWEHGPFEIWDAIGLDQGIELMKEEGHEVAQWIDELVKADIHSFYSSDQNARSFYDVPSKSYAHIPGQESFIILENTSKNNLIWSNSGAAIHHLGDGILNVEFKSKMNTLGGEVLQAINKGIDLAEQEYDAIILGNQGQHFSVGANLAMVFMMAVEQEYDELNFSVRYFQDTVMRLRYSCCPTLIAPHGYTFGGACEMSLHADKVIAASESYIGLVEFGVGLIPGGAGSKEMALRASEGVLKDDVKLNKLRDYFINVAMAKVATSAYEAFDLGFLKEHKDLVVVNRDRQIATAKEHALQMLRDGYVAPTPKEVLVYGQQALGMFLVGTDSLVYGKYASEHDQKIANRLGYVMAGGDLSEPTLVSEQYLLDIEREQFMSLLTERKTLERIEHMLKTGKPLRN